MFYKLQSGNLQRLKLPLRVGGEDIFTNDPIILAAHGYYPLEVEDYPEGEEARYEQRYELRDGVIYGTWVEVEDDV